MPFSTGTTSTPPTPPPHQAPPPPANRQTGTDKPDMNFWLTLPEIRGQACLSPLGPLVCSQRIPQPAKFQFPRGGSIDENPPLGFLFFAWRPPPPPPGPPATTGA